jgi:hypothetical protein
VFVRKTRLKVVKKLRQSVKSDQMKINRNYIICVTDMLEDLPTNATWNSLYVEKYQSDGRRNFEPYFLEL